MISTFNPYANQSFSPQRTAQMNQSYPRATFTTNLILPEDDYPTLRGNFFDESAVYKKVPNSFQTFRVVGEEYAASRLEANAGGSRYVGPFRKLENKLSPNTPIEDPPEIIYEKSISTSVKKPNKANYPPPNMPNNNPFQQGFSQPNYGFNAQPSPYMQQSQFNPMTQSYPSFNSYGGYGGYGGYQNPFMYSAYQQMSPYQMGMGGQNYYGNPYQNQGAMGAEKINLGTDDGILRALEKQGQLLQSVAAGMNNTSTDYGRQEQLENRIKTLETQKTNLDAKRPNRRGY